MVSPRTDSGPRIGLYDAGVGTEETVERSPVFQSGAYTPDAEDAAQAEAAEWLEIQAGMPFIVETAERSMEFLALEPGQRVLDVGCGTGVFLPRLAAAVRPRGGVVGLDHTPQFLREAAARVERDALEHVELVEGDAASLPFPDGAFDAAHCERVLMHLPDPDAAIREMRRVVRPGGTIVAAEVNAYNTAIDSPDPEASAQLSRALVSGIRNPTMGISLRRRFVQAGLVEIRGRVVALFEESIEADEVLEIQVHADEEVAAGRLDAERAQAVMDALRAALDAGQYCGVAMIFVVAGRVP